MTAAEALDPSPYLNGLQYAWDSTSLGWLKDCPRKYQLAQREGWRSKARATALTFGLYYHKALELFDRLTISIGMPREEALIEVVRQTLIETNGWVSDETARTREHLIRSIVWYIDEFATDPLKTVILQNGKPAVELSFQMNLDWGPLGSNQPYVLCGHIDRIVDFSGGLYVTDRKTTGSTVGSYYFERFDLDNQMSLYTVAAGVVFHTPVKGVIVDAAQIAVGFTRFARGMTYRTPAQSNEWLKDLTFWLLQAERYAEADYWPMNESSCMLCPFKKVCAKDPDVRPTILASDFVQQPWNPLKVR
jgi:hypothetical protein